jgi:ribosomal protein S18 acetylase RimI-like enzyme
MELRWIDDRSEVDSVVAASDLFDAAAKPEWAARFLADPDHHLCLAIDDGAAVGFVTGVEMTHPDKGTEMFLYELGVDERHRRRGIGRALVTALASRAEERGCYGMWVLTERDNQAAMRTYAAAGAGNDSDEVMLEWRFD